MTATLDRISNGRLLINVVTGGDPVENRGDGLFLAVLTGPGAVWLQTLPISRLAHQISEYLPKAEARQNTTAAGLGGGLLGGVIGSILDGNQ